MGEHRSDRAHTILFVDDDAQNRHLMTRLFQKRRPDDRVLTVASADEAIETARTEIPDLVLLDLNLHGASGEDVLKVLRSESSIPVVMVTGDVDPDIQRRLREQGANDVVLKPFDADALFALIESLLP